MDKALILWCALFTSCTLFDCEPKEPIPPTPIPEVKSDFDVVRHDPTTIRLIFYGERFAGSGWFELAYDGTYEGFKQYNAWVFLPFKDYPVKMIVYPLSGQSDKRLKPREYLLEGVP